MTPELYWLIVTIITFFILFLPAEIIFYRDEKPGGTLSETVWGLLYPKPGSRFYRYRRWIRIGFVMAFVWLIPHLLFRGWF